MNVLEAPASLLVVLAALVFFTSVSHATAYNRAGEYADYCRKIRVLLASELLMTSAEKGLAVYDQNKVFHHVIDPSKLRFLKSLSPEDLGRRLGLRRAWLEPVPGKACVKRAGLLAGEVHAIVLCGE